MPEPVIKFIINFSKYLHKNSDKKSSHTIHYFVSFVFCNTGTSAIRSNRPLEPNMIHYFEIKILNWHSGTDLVSNILKRKPNRNIFTHHTKYCILLSQRGLLTVIVNL